MKDIAREVRRVQRVPGHVVDVRVAAVALVRHRVPIFVVPQAEQSGLAAAIRNLRSELTERGRMALLGCSTEGAEAKTRRKGRLQ